MILECVWPPDNDMPSTPWESIQSHATTYFNVDSLPHGVVLTKPELMTRTQVYLLLDHIYSCQSSTLSSKHFAFRSKAEIQQYLDDDDPLPTTAVLPTIDLGNDTTTISASELVTGKDDSADNDKERENPEGDLGDAVGRYAQYSFSFMSSHERLLFYQACTGLRRWKRTRTNLMPLNSQRRRTRHKFPLTSGRSHLILTNPRNVEI
jgi:hypothetical protein